MRGVILTTETQRSCFQSAKHEVQRDNFVRRRRIHQGQAGKPALHRYSVLCCAQMGTVVRPPVISLTMNAKAWMNPPSTGRNIA